MDRPRGVRVAVQGRSPNGRVQPPTGIRRASPSHTRADALYRTVTLGRVRPRSPSEVEDLTHDVARYISTLRQRQDSPRGLPVRGGTRLGVDSAAGRSTVRQYAYAEVARDRAIRFWIRKQVCLVR